jgi:hypothetical protein
MPKTISGGHSPKIEIEQIAGDLSLVGWDGEDILIKADDDQLRVKQNGDSVSISCDDDLSLRVPKLAAVSIKRINGDASLRALAGAIQLDAINGNLSVREVASVSVGTIQSDFSLRAATGSLSIKSIQGDVSIRDVDGNVSLESVADDLTLRDVRGSVSANVGADVVLYLDPRPSQKYSVNAGDDILLVMSPKANATLTLHADEIDVHWPGVKNHEAGAQHVLKMGDGSAKIALNAGGSIRVTDQANAAESADEFGNFAGVNFDWSGFGETIARRVDLATRHAQHLAERATLRAAQKMARSMSRRAGRPGPASRWSLGFDSAFPVEARQSISDEEHMAILKMLQEKKITSDEAEKLLKALEGGS